MKQLGNGRNGWFIVLGFVAAWDILSEDTLSEAFGRAVHSKSSPAVVAAWAVLTAHLFDVLPSSLDPFHIFLKVVKSSWRARASMKMASALAS